MNKLRGGKSTMLNMVAGFEQPTAGSFGIDGGTPRPPGPDRAVVLRESAPLMPPKLLLMDEPFGALDAQMRLQMQQLLLHVWQPLKRTVISHHDIDEADPARRCRSV